MVDRYSDEGMALDLRLTPYRDRAADLYRGGEQVGQVFVESAVYREFAGGPPWRRRWGPAIEMARVFVHLDGQWVDDYVEPVAVGASVDAWANDRYELHGEELRLRWLSELDSRLAEERHINEAALAPQQATELIDLIWSRHRLMTIPPPLRLEPVAGVDLRWLDTGMTRAMKEWRDLGRLDRSALEFLAGLVTQLDAAMPQLDALERLYYRRTQRVAMRVLAFHA